MTAVSFIYKMLYNKTRLNTMFDIYVKNVWIFLTPDVKLHKDANINILMNILFL